jgi:hypothetical protein
MKKMVLFSLVLFLLSEALVADQEYVFPAGFIGSGYPDWFAVGAGLLVPFAEGGPGACMSEDVFYCAYADIGFHTDGLSMTYTVSTGISTIGFDYLPLGGWNAGIIAALSFPGNNAAAVWSFGVRLRLKIMIFIVGCDLLPFATGQGAYDSGFFIGLGFI